MAQGLDLEQATFCDSSHKLLRATLSTHRVVEMAFNPFADEIPEVLEAVRAATGGGKFCEKPQKVLGVLTPEAHEWLPGDMMWGGAPERTHWT